MKPVGYTSDSGRLYAIKLAIPAYENLRDRTEAISDTNTGPLHEDIPTWDFRGRDKENNTYVIIFTTKPWWMKQQYAGLCDIAGVRNKTRSESEDEK